MKRYFRTGSGIIWAIALGAALLIAGSCNFFDPLNPLQRSATNTGDGSEVTWEKLIKGPGDDGGMSIEQVQLNLPEKAKIEPSEPCTVCGEPTMESMLHDTGDGRLVCRSCGVGD